MENAEQRIAALEAELLRQGQVATQLQQELTSARADTARALSTATNLASQTAISAASSSGGAGGAASVDTRLLGKPVIFEGTDEAWPHFQLILKGDSVDITSFEVTMHCFGANRLGFEFALAVNFKTG